MTVKLYLDVYFAVNFAMDYLLLSMVKCFFHLPARPLRLAMGALAGAGWACVDLLLGLAGWIQLAFAWLGAGSLMVALAFGLKKSREGMRELAVRLVAFWAVSAAAGGLLGIWESRNFQWYLPGEGGFGQWNLMALCFGAAGIYFGVSGCLKFISGHMQEQHILYQVRLSCKGRTKTVNALWDTGNHLYEPYSHQPVHVITREVCQQLCNKVSQIIYIPFRTVGSDYGLMPGIRIDFMEVEKDGKLIRRYERPWLAVSQNPLSADCQYEMLLHGKK